MTEAEEQSAQTDPGGQSGRPGRPWWQRVLIGLGAGLLAVGIVLAAVYGFGGISGSAFDPEIRDLYRQMVESGQVQPVEKRFVIPIPGCTCHSRDPYLTEQHRNRRLSECMGCHGAR